MDEFSQVTSTIIYGSKDKKSKDKNFCLLIKLVWLTKNNAFIEDEDSL
jgi:hypothetical protein